MHLLYKSYIEKAGYQLLAAKSAEEGLALTRSEKPALIVMDIILTGMDGLAALRELKADEATKSIPVIIVTAAISQQHHATRQESMAAGAALLLTKPVGPGQLVAEIMKLAPIGGDPASASGR
jgi:CheY-like chemotaxis protein